MNHNCKQNFITVNTKKIWKNTIAILTSVVLVVSMTPFFSQQAHADKQSEAAAALSQLTSLQEQLGTLENAYNDAASEQEEAENKVQEAEEKINDCNEKISKLQKQLSSRAKSMYRSGASSWLDVILGSSTFTEFATNWGILESINQSDSDMVSESKSLREEVSEQKQVLDEQKKVAEEKEATAKAKYDEAQTLVANQQAVYDNLNAEAKAELEAQQAAKEAANRAAATSRSSSGGGGGNYNDNKPQTVTGNVVVDRAYAELGKPYVWGGVGPGGYDCSGFVSYCLTGAHRRLGTTTTFMNWTRVSNPQPGDVCVCSYHTGIYIGGGQMIHAATYGIGVVIGSVQSDMIYVRY
jgi:peptidoglycan DL-endopeptidase CwlO